jgi:hypothetical protein
MWSGWRPGGSGGRGVYAYLMVGGMRGIRLGVRLYDYNHGPGAPMPNQALGKGQTCMHNGYL